MCRIVIFIVFDLRNPSLNPDINTVPIITDTDAQIRIQFYQFECLTILVGWTDG
jgi:hypothetical protein